jgi:type II secretory pathway pseudopilin PulG
MSRRPGFSLLEVMISVSLVVSIFVILVGALVSAWRDNHAQQSALTAVDNAQRIVRSTVSLIRQAQTSPTGAYPIVAATSTSLNFYTANGSVIQQARLYLDGTSLKLGRTQPDANGLYATQPETITTLLTGVRNGSQPVFQYFDEDYAGTNTSTNPMTTITPNDIRMVRMTVIFDDNLSAPPSASTIELQAQLRNLKDNY